MTHSPLTGSHNGAAASGQSSLATQGIGPVVLLSLLPLLLSPLLPSVPELSSPVLVLEPLRHAASSANERPPPHGL
ncbi:hypothetical protein [Paraliomyxa miuraensis]|uniref:hypothetical protein n=1 Tax=Paraliomyxa miuraensis TaxID=376150 RepID=UPI002258D5C1|nr:hypothetical protein [Paraliomyxa miuraensis]MCX4239114.1 hypothetical protein [Paraliomyxa miuraensis]